MEMGIDLKIWLIVWVVILLVIAFSSARKNVSRAGLVAIFAFHFSLEHLFGALIYSLPWYEGKGGYFTALGFTQASWAFMAFAFGSLILAPFIIKAFRPAWIKGKKYIPNLKMPIVYIVTGYIFYFTLNPILGGIPSVRTFVHSGWNLMIAGLCLIIWKNWCIKKKKMIIFWLSFAALAPAFTTISLGFLGVGVGALIIIVAFTARFYRPLWQVTLGAVLVVYFGFSFYVNYMEARGRIRAVPVHERTSVFFEMFDDFKFFSLSEQSHLELIDERINLNFLTGAAVDYLDEGYQDFAKGRTIKDSFLAFVPRVIWPEKPVRLGGSEMVTDHTGMSFPEGTSVAPGLVMEFYINFGTACVVVGFLILGIIVAFVDIAAGARLQSGDWRGFIFWFVPGITLISTTILTQVFMTAAAAIVFSLIINKYIMPLVLKQKKAR